MSRQRSAPQSSKPRPAPQARGRPRVRLAEDRSFAVALEAEQPLARLWSLVGLAHLEPCQKSASRVLEEHEACDATSWAIR